MFRNKTFRQSGFTLLELLVVMVILGLLVGYVAPKYFARSVVYSHIGNDGCVYSGNKKLQFQALPGSGWDGYDSWCTC